MSEKEVQKKVYDRNEVAANLRGYADAQALTDDEVRIALRAIDWINASPKNSQGKLSEKSGVSTGRLSPFSLASTPVTRTASSRRSATSSFGSRQRERSRQSRSSRRACGSASNS